MKIIFLDHDGVICTMNQFGSRYKKQKKWGGRKMSMTLREIPIEHRFDNFDKKCIKVLNEILEETGAEIVVSSDWKGHATVEELGTYYEMQGIVKKPIDSTRFFSELEFKPPTDFEWIKAQDLEQYRHFEILDWLKRNPSVTHWVSVDDLNMSINIESRFYGKETRDWGLENFVHTDEWEGIKRSGHKEKIIKYLL